MILTVAAALSLLGFVTWSLGSVFSYHGLAAIGGIVVVAVGAAGMADGGYAYETGTIERQTGENTTEKATQYDTVELPGSFNFGMVVVFVGTIMTFRSLIALGKEGADA